VWIGDTGGHEINAVLDVDELGIKVFMSKIWRANWRVKEAEASCKFNREGWAKDGDVVGFGGASCNGITDGGSKEGVALVDFW
jgi:hypothetical protein